MPAASTTGSASPKFPASPAQLADYDVVVVGAGAAGLSAASTAAALGRRVLVVETSDRIGGTTAVSGGMVWIPANHKMADAGIADDLDLARAYLRATVPGFDASTVIWSSGAMDLWRTGSRAPALPPRS